MCRPVLVKYSVVVLVFFISPIGASELTRGVSSSNLGTNPFTTPFFERGLHLNSSRWFYRTPPTLVGRLQLSLPSPRTNVRWLVSITGGHRTTPYGIIGWDII